MTKQTINLGTPPGGTDGDTTRSGFTKTNANFDELYLREQGKLTKDVGGAGTIALTDADALAGVIDLSGVLTGARVVTVPPSPPQRYLVRNSTTGAYALTFKTSTGSTAVDIRPGQTVSVYSDGTNIVDPSASISGRLIGIRTFTSSGTYTPTPGTTSIVVRVQGGGGGGAGSPATGSGQNSSGSGGGGGGYAEHRFTSGFSGASFVVGAAGSGGTGAAGGAGGTSSFAGVSALGGLGGVVGAPGGVASYAIPAAGGGASGGNIANVAGQPSTPVSVIVTGGINLGAGGCSHLGGGGLSTIVGAGVAGTGYGGGGGGNVQGPSSGALSGGMGAPGAIIVLEYS
ncbi:hypothetical protein PAN31117_03101 [Pandoraea anapnoica]|uniref:Uncharacterized protein n=1 Tax=Pandoraea anapnoica TaxID=2508301 RepID=A0A5E5A6U2_9BURK|nr:hypothetical protein PAN31117_03101 [Pandoraea anapnoica]